KDSAELAVADFDKALARLPEYAKLYEHRGMVRVLSGRLDPALEDADEALRRNRDSDNARILRGMVYLRKGDFDQAVTELREAVRVNRKSETAWFNLALAYHAKGDRAAAEAAMKEAGKSGDLGKVLERFGVKFNAPPPAAPAAPKPTASDLVAEGERLLKARDYRAAAERFTKAIELDPKRADALGGRGK